MANHAFLSIISAFLTSFIMLFLAQATYAVEYNESDYIVKVFGINNTNPYIMVEGIAGGSYDTSMGDEGYNAYVFDTDKGIFQVGVSYPSGEDKPVYSTSRILSNITNVGDCLLTEETYGTLRLDNQTVEYIDPKIQFTKVSGAITIVVSNDDPTEDCSSGEHIRKIISDVTMSPVPQN